MKTTQGQATNSPLSVHGRSNKSPSALESNKSPFTGHGIIKINNRFQNCWQKAKPKLFFKKYLLAFLLGTNGRPP
jgi:hypothetical protein